MKLTLRPCDKLTLKSEFAHVRDTGRKLAAPLLLAIVASSADGKARCGVVCGRKFSLKAVERNRVRRLLWESFRLLKRRILPCHMILIPRKRLLDSKMQDAMNQLKRALAEARLIAPEEGSSKS